MKEGNWEECLENDCSLEVTPNKPKARFLIETADGRIKYVRENQLKESNANYIFENYYSSVLELAHALTLLAGFKVNNHICLGYYLRDVIKNDSLFRLFDDCRFKRNSLIYYGKSMDFEVAKGAIKKCETLISELKLLVGSKLG